MFKKAFTMIELLVVIAIIGILSGFVYIQTDNAINSGKDAKRKSDIALLSTAVVSYSSEHYSLAPVTDVNGCTIGGGSDPCSTDIEDTIESYLGVVPNDPNSGTYYTYQSDGTDCTISASLSNGETYQYLCSEDDSTVGTPTSGSCGTKANTITTGYASSQTDWTTNTTYCSSTSPTTTPAFPPTSGSSVSWVCPGTYLGGSVSCTAYRAADGSCGSGTANTYTIPTSGFCSSGSTSSISGTGPWTWTCSGTYGGSTASCTANKSVDGVCGSLINTTSTAYLPAVTAWPSSNYCSSGSVSPTPIFPSTASSTSWTCNGAYSGTSASCIAYRGQDGVCGSSNGSYLYSAPTSGLCLTGTASASGAWSWTCPGTYGGATVSCSAIQKIDGTCGSSNGANFYSAPTSGLCTTGTASASGAWSWNCVGQNTGATVSCSANQSVNGACGTANGKTYTMLVTSYGSDTICSSGTYSTPSFPTQSNSTVSWTCTGANGGTSATCSSSVKKCSTAGGTVTSCSTASCCQFSGSSCPSGWTQLNSWSTTVYSGGTLAGQCCNGECDCVWGCDSSCVGLGYHSWSNSGQETCTQPCAPSSCGVYCLADHVWRATITQIGCY